jgi:hypothetical protein
MLVMELLIDLSYLVLSVLYIHAFGTSSVSHIHDICHLLDQNKQKLKQASSVFQSLNNQKNWSQTLQENVSMGRAQLHV